MSVEKVIRQVSEDIYALGKTHGRIDALNEMLELIVEHGQHHGTMYDEVRALIRQTIAEYPKSQSKPPVKENAA